VSQRGVTVGQLLDEWLELGRSKQKPRTLQENRRKIDHRIRPLLGDLKLEKLDAARLDKTYRHWLDRGLSEATVHKYHCILSAACRQAVKWDYIDRAPTDKASPPRIVRREPKTPTPEQLADLIGTAEGDDPLMAKAIALAALTGTPRSELVALQWSDVDLAAGRVRIWKGLTVANGQQYIGDTKTHAARELALDPIAVEVLRRRREFMAVKSTGGVATCFDNSAAESFWSSLKRELVHRYRFTTRARGHGRHQRLDPALQQRQASLDPRLRAVDRVGAALPSDQPASCITKCPAGGGKVRWRRAGKRGSL
jgi:integrase